MVQGLRGNKYTFGNPSNAKFRNKSKTCTSVICLNNNKVYKSIKEAAIELGLCANSIRNQVNEKNDVENVSGYKFKKANS